MVGETTHTYEVLGMTCNHCLESVREEVAGLPGVTGVDVDLGDGRLVVTGNEVERERIRVAVELAGYELTDERQW